VAYAQAKHIDQQVIPVVDITPLREGTDPKPVARALHAASQGLGFIYIKGHGIPQEVIEAARSSAFAFFRSPEDLKRTVAVSPKHRGWLGRGGARMQDNARADLKESFIWGFQDEAGDTPEDHPLRGPNRWPAFLPDMQDHAMAYFDRAHAVAHHLMAGFALGLDLDEDFFLRTAARPLSRASYVYYPAQPEELGSEQFGVGPHTDFGVLTVLCQDSVGGLQVQDASGEWIHAPPIEGTLVVNVADLLARWTDGAYTSTPHRVVNASGRERLSLVLAFDPDPDTPIDARDVFGPGHSPKQPPITCGDYLIWRFGKAFSYRDKGDGGQDANPAR
jgi:isopenicillin N synthase-like dioxygenase